MTPLFLVTATTDAPPPYECVQASVAVGDAAVGDLGDIEGLKLGDVLIAPRSQAYFWTPAWQRDELAADEDIAEGRVDRFESAEAAISALRAGIE